MNKKRMQKLALQIAQLELVRNNSESSADKRKTERKIVELASQVESMEDILLLDDMIQKYLT